MNRELSRHVFFTQGKKILSVCLPKFVLPKRQTEWKPRGWIPTAVVFFFFLLSEQLEEKEKEKQDNKTKKSKVEEKELEKPGLKPWLVVEMTKETPEGEVQKHHFPLPTNPSS